MAAKCYRFITVLYLLCDFLLNFAKVKIRKRCVFWTGCDIIGL